MTNLKIIPNFEKKTAKFEGVIAAGEKIHATIENVGGFIASTQNLRLRAVASDGGTLAEFPQENELGEVVENWSFDGDTIECDLNLNTVQMLEAVPPAARVMVLFVLDNPEGETLYFKLFCTVDHWPRRVGEEEPVDLGGYADFVQDAKQSIKDAEAAIKTASSSAQSAADRAGKAEESAKAAQESATASVGSAATYASEAEKARDEANSRANSASEFANNAKASQTAAESAKTAAETARDEAKGYAESMLANAATKAELQVEVERATAAESKNAAAIDETGKALVAETERAKTAEQNLASEVSEVGDKVDNLVAGDAKKSARTIAAEEVAKVVANAPADFDTLKEIAAYIESDKIGAAQMVTQIDANTKSISAEVKRAKGAEEALDGRVKTLEEKPPLDASVTKQSANGVKSSGIWSAVWGALAALPTGFTSLYDWCVSQLAKKLDKSGGTLTGGLTFEGEQFGIKFNDNRQSISFSNGINIGQYGILINGKPVYYPSASGTLALTSDIPNVHYPLGEPITASARLADRTMNRVNASSTLTDAIDLTFPAAVQGMGRDFLVRVHRETGGVAINFTVPAGAKVFGDGFASAIGEGEDWLYAITETAANEWYVLEIKLEIAE